MSLLHIRYTKMPSLPFSNCRICEVYAWPLAKPIPRLPLYIVHWHFVFDNTLSRVSRIFKVKLLRCYLVLKKYTKGINNHVFFLQFTKFLISKTEIYAVNYNVIKYSPRLFLIIYTIFLIFSDWYKVTFHKISKMLQMLVSWFLRPPFKILNDQQIKRLKAGTSSSWSNCFNWCNLGFKFRERNVLEKENNLPDILFAKKRIGIMVLPCLLSLFFWKRSITTGMRSIMIEESYEKLFLESPVDIRNISKEEISGMIGKCGITLFFYLCFL